MADTLNYCFADTPIGRLRLLSDGEALVRIEFQDQHGTDGEKSDAMLRPRVSSWRSISPAMAPVSLPLGAGGTAFQHSVWDALERIPYGELRSYRDIARRYRQPQGRAGGGRRERAQPLPIVVPCHRVVGSDGRLTGLPAASR